MTFGFRCPPLAAASLIALPLAATALTPALAADMPAQVEQVVRDLDLSDVDYRPDPRGTDLTGQLPDGSLVRIDFHDRGREELEEIEAHGRDAVPLSQVAAVLPEGLLAAGPIGPDDGFYEIDFDDDGSVDIEGLTADGRRFDAEYDRAGRLDELDYD
ncbi:hypothetical protein [Marinibacterium sp. SX1]|uniref:hypothetical protein n=1 Tax=Marinibacterium sp. SX1 TaxID=3388424 RepID=UPI003D17BE96